MNNPELVIMAAGMGSRYGGLKQIDPIDEYGHIIIDYSIYDAMRAGFRDFTFIIKKAIERDFCEIMEKHLAGKDINVKYVFQELDKIPDGFTVPEERTKPYGTAHAIMCCRGIVNAPFAVINADDYYGANAFTLIYDFLKNAKDTDKYHYAMVGYPLGNTVTEQGSVARGVCEVEGGYLKTITERTGIMTDGERIFYNDEDRQVNLPADTVVSMNLWGFTPSYIEECYRRFPAFLKKGLAENPLKCEFYLPGVVDALMNEGLADVRVIEGADKWYGVTYKEDKPKVMEAFRNLRESGVYPEILA